MMNIFFGPMYGYKRIAERWKPFGIPGISLKKTFVPNPVKINSILYKLGSKTYYFTWTKWPSSQIRREFNFSIYVVMSNTKRNAFKKKESFQWEMFFKYSSTLVILYFWFVLSYLKKYLNFFCLLFLSFAQFLECYVKHLYSKFQNFSWLISFVHFLRSMEFCVASRYLRIYYMKLHSHVKYLEMLIASVECGFVLEN